MAITALPLVFKAHCNEQEHTIKLVSAGMSLSVRDNSVFFFDALEDVNFADYSNDSFIIIIYTNVAGTTIS